MTQCPALVTYVLVFLVSYRVCDICVTEQKAGLNKLVDGRLLYTSQHFLVTE